jgi:membrane-bound serine protease (ClpP class)
VRESASITESEALKAGVIDLVAPSFSALIDSLDGRRVEVLSGSHRIQTEDARVVEIEMSFRERVLSKISDPNIAYVLMMLGMYGIMFELYNPGSVLPGVIGSICLILAFYAFQTLPVNYAGLLLIILGIILFILEVKVPSYGILTIGGITALVLGSTMLFETPGSLVRISWSVIAPTVAGTALFFIFAVGMGIRAQRASPYLDDLVGQTGIARTDINADGTVFIAGEYWQAACDGHIDADKHVRVIRIDGPRLTVKQV